MHSKIFTACFLGAFIGALVALQLQPQLWWIGLVIGGFAGYLSYEFKAVLRAVPTAYSAARGWRPDGEFWKVKVRNIGIFIGLTQTMLVGLFLAFVHTPSAAISITPESWNAIALMTVVMHVMMGLCGFTMPARDRRGEIIYMPDSYSEMNPFKVYLWHLPRATFFAVRWMIVGLPQALAFCLRVAGFLKRFSVFLFREIHSDARLLCACDASIGAAIGYFTGNAVVGGIAGGIFGVLNYEVVSKRLLHIEVRR